MDAAVQRFACTQCGKCCNRSPEVELCEAAALADVFVFRLMFRLYSLPRNRGDYRAAARCDAARANEAFYEKKRLLSAFAARKYIAKVRADGRVIEQVNYLLFSALALDTASGSCPALNSGRCSIYERRPLTCRTVPFHYSRPEALAESDLKAFVETPGYRCARDDQAALVLEGGRIVDATMREARARAVAIAEADRPWGEAIVRRMKGEDEDHGLPSLRQVKANARLGALTVSMRTAWEIAAEARLIDPKDCRGLVASQLKVIGSELAAGRCSSETRQTLLDMQAEYRPALEQSRRIKTEPYGHTADT